MSLSAGQLRSQVLGALKKSRDKGREPHCFGLFHPSGWGGPSELTIDGGTWRVVEVRSSLAAREALAVAGPEHRVVLVSTVPDGALGHDVLARLALSRLLLQDRFATLKELFRANSVDPRVLPHLEFIEILTDDARTAPITPAPNGHLSPDALWSELLANSWAMPREATDLAKLVEWARKPEARDRICASSARFTESAGAWIAARMGPGASEVLCSMQTPGAPDPLVLGLACDVLFGERTPVAEAVAPRTRFERFTGDRAIDPESARRWGRASAEVLQHAAAKDRYVLAATAQQLDTLLATLHATNLAEHSTWSLLGLDSLYDRFGTVLTGYLDRPRAETLAELSAIRDRIVASRVSSLHEERVTRVRMSYRLAVWLASTSTRDPIAQHHTLADAAKMYAMDECFVDRARAALCHGDSSRVLADANRKLLAAVGMRRAAFDHRFAELLASRRAGVEEAELIPVQDLLARVIAPFGESARLLVIVLDGMSASISSELLEDVTAQGWRSIWQDSVPRMTALAALPSLTELSRTSLLSGRLQRGGQAEEVAGFAGHPEFKRVSRGIAPKLFHKSGLTTGDDATLSAELSDAIASECRYVGAVVNAIDDHLSKCDQLAWVWRSASIRVLPSLLARARDSGRAVVLVSDHGHLLEQGTTMTRESSSDRFRSPSPLADEGEIEITPASAGLGVSEEPLVFAWKDSIRYGQRKNGYHGGVSPQEMVIAVSVLWPSHSLPPGWSDATHMPPDWWDGGATQAPSTLPKPAKPAAAPSLFEPAALAKAGLASSAEQPAWLAAMLRSELLESQRKRAGRHSPSVQEIEKFLTALADRGGKLTLAALTRALSIPPIRIGGFVTQMRRILNIEGYPVLDIHEESESVELNVPLLKTQFGL